MLCHKPYIFNNIADKNLDLIVSGHTHGGQIVFVKLGDFNLSIAASISKYVSGYYREGNSQMYVSRGIGTVALPIRLNCPPEITMLTLE
jgi:predicted MPP superfamily phosphohydrolase